MGLGTTGGGGVGRLISPYLRPMVRVGMRKVREIMDDSLRLGREWA